MSAEGRLGAEVACALVLRRSASQTLPGRGADNPRYLLGFALSSTEGGGQTDEMFGSTSQCR